MGKGSGILPADLRHNACGRPRVAFPVMVKPATGSCGIGMLPARNQEELAAARGARRIACRSAASGDRRGVPGAAYGDSRGTSSSRCSADPPWRAAPPFERDCSVQRRHQESSRNRRAPGMDRRPRCRDSRNVTGHPRHAWATTTSARSKCSTTPDGFRFLEMNTRLQVEHGVTEEVNGIDLVAVPDEAAPPASAWTRCCRTPAAQGHAIQVRVYAEDPERFLPSPGPLRVFRPPQGEGIRIETGYAEGNTVTPFYDPMLAKVIARGRDAPAGDRADAGGAFGHVRHRRRQDQYRLCPPGARESGVHCRRRAHGARCAGAGARQGGRRARIRCVISAGTAAVN